jgi:hypothetical protein
MNTYITNIATKLKVEKYWAKFQIQEEALVAEINKKLGAYSSFEIIVSTLLTYFIL